MTKRYCHYDKDTLAIVGFYSEKAHGENIPTPAVEITLEQIEEVNKQQYTHIQVENGVLVGFEQVTPELTEAQLRENFKRERSNLIAKLTVEVDGMVFDADEISRSRMADTIVGLESGETNLWVLADNTVVHLTKEKLKEVLRAIGAAQTALWVQ